MQTHTYMLAYHTHTYKHKIKVYYKRNCHVKSHSRLFCMVADIGQCSFMCSAVLVNVLYEEINL